MVALSLDCLTLTDASPVETIRAAGAAGFDHVSLWFSAPSAFPKALVRAQDVGEIAGAMADCGISLHSVEPFELASAEAVASYRPALELGARLGGKSVLAYHTTPHDGAGAADMLTLLVETAAEFGLGVNVEPVAMGETRTLAQARDLIRASGADAGILFDTWHLMRSGGGIAELRAIEPELIRYVQINDGLLAHPPEDMMAEAMGERLYPGKGEFPLAELLRHVRRDIPWGIECPSLSRVAAGIGPEGQALEAMAAMRALLDELIP